MPASSLPTPYFLDSSALVKRYLIETGTPWVESVCAPAVGNAIVAAQIGLVEVAAALAGKKRAGFIDAAKYDQVLDDLIDDAQAQYTLVDIDQPVIALAIDLTRRHKLRGYDAVQLAAALTVGPALTVGGFAPLVFVSADRNLLSAAQAEALVTEDPNEH